MQFCIGDKVREGMHVGTVTDVGGVLIQIETTMGTSRIVCPWELVRIRPSHEEIGSDTPPLQSTSQAVIPPRDVQEATLAWALIDAAKPHMNAGERNYAFVTIGAGDTFAAIRQLLRILAAERIPLQPTLVQLCRAWLNAYVLHEEYEHLRRLIEGLSMPDTIQASTAIRRLPTAPKPCNLLTVSRRRLPSERTSVCRALR